MRLNEIVETEQLDEAGELKKALAIGLLGGAGLFANKLNTDFERQQTATRATQTQPTQVAPVQQAPEPQPVPQDARQAELAKWIAHTYRVDQDFAKEVVELAHKYQKPTFPKAEHILAIAAIESSFQPDAVSRLKRDPARGLMQVRPGVWGLDSSELQDPEDQIRIGTEILHQYYKKLRDPKKAVQAYNVGITDFRSGRTAPNYLNKFKTALSHFESI